MWAEPASTKVARRRRPWSPAREWRISRDVGPTTAFMTGDLRVDMERVRQRKRDIVNSFRTASETRIEKTANLELIFGEASFTGPKSVARPLKDGGEASARSRYDLHQRAAPGPSVPPLDGLKDVPFLDSTSIMELDRRPGTSARARRRRRRAGVRARCSVGSAAA